MDRRDIAAQLISMPMSFAGSDNDPGFGTRVSRMVNEGHAEVIAAHPGRLGAFAMLLADGPDSALAELAYALDALGVLHHLSTTGRGLGFQAAVRTGRSGAPGRGHDATAYRIRLTSSSRHSAPRSSAAGNARAARSNRTRPPCNYR
jgi:hypothetical protein